MVPSICSPLLPPPVDVSERVMFKLSPGVVASISVEKKDDLTPFSITKAKDVTARKPWGFWHERRQRGDVLSSVASKSELIFCVGLWAWLNVVEDSAAAGSSNGGDAAASVVFLAVSLLATVLSAAAQPHNLTRGLLLGAVSFLSLCTGASHARLSGQLTVYAVGACVLVYCLPVGAPLGTVNERALVGAALVRVGSRVVRRSLAGPVRTAASNSAKPCKTRLGPMVTNTHACDGWAGSGW